jgi:WD40 repeat protein
MRLGSPALRTGHSFSPIAISPDGQFAASKVGNSSIAVWETATGRRLQKLTPKVPVGPGLALTFSPRGHQLAVISDGGPVDIWDTASGRLVHSVPAEVRENWERSAVAFSDDGKLLAFATNSQAESEVVVVRTSDWEQVKLLKSLRHSYLNPLRVSGTCVVAWSGREVVTWDMASGEIVHTFETRSLDDAGPSYQVFLSPDGSLMAAATSEGDVNLKRVADDGWGHVIDNARGTSPVAFSYDNSVIAMQNAGDHAARLVETRSGKRIAELRGATVSIDAMEMSRDGNFLAASSGHRLLVWDLRERQLLASCIGPEIANRLVFSPDDRLLCSEDYWEEYLRETDRGIPAVHVWSTETGECVWSVEGAREPCFLPDGDGIAMIEGNQLVAYTVGSDMRRWSREMDLLREGESRTVPTIEGKTPLRLDIRRLAMSSDGSRFVYDVGGWRLAVYDRPKDRVWFVEPDGDERFPPFGLAVSPANNDHVLVGHLLFDVNTGKVLARYPSRAMVSGIGRPDDFFAVPRAPSDIAFDRAGERVAVLDGTRDDARGFVATVDLYSVKSGKLLDSPIRQKWTPPVLFAEVPRGFAFSPDGRLAALVGDDSRVHVFDTANGKDVAQVPAQSGHVVSVTFSHDGKRLATGLSDTTIVIWDLEALGLITPDSYRDDEARPE